MSSCVRVPAGGIHTIKSGTAFLDTLAAGILDRYGAHSETLADVRVLLPTRRSCRALGEAFLRVTGGVPILLPVMTPIGDLDDDELGPLGTVEPAIISKFNVPPAIPILRRQLLLSRL
ncbi:MAG: double-strand break repair protein AddB, partial [Pseudomonadota bacterium]|nr:double-strand break repair protein AddB [Pseudomonadota bacterium]